MHYNQLSDPAEKRHICCFLCLAQIRVTWLPSAQLICRKHRGKSLLSQPPPPLSLSLKQLHQRALSGEPLCQTCD